MKSNPNYFAPLIGTLLFTLSAFSGMANKKKFNYTMANTSKDGVTYKIQGFAGNGNEIVMSVQAYEPDGTPKGDPQIREGTIEHDLATGLERVKTKVTGSSDGLQKEQTKSSPYSLNEAADSMQSTQTIDPELKDAPASSQSTDTFDPEFNEFLDYMYQ